MLKHTQKGFTLVEIIIYVAIFVLMFGSISLFSNMITDSRSRNQLILEVNDQGERISRLILQTIRNSRSISTPLPQTASSSLTLNTGDVSTDPTVFYISSGILYMQEGISPSVAISNDKIKINNIEFSNLSRSSTPGIIRYSMNITNSGTSQKAALIYSNNIYGSASIH